MGRLKKVFYHFLGGVGGGSADQGQGSLNPPGVPMTVWWGRTATFIKFISILAKFKDFSMFSAFPGAKKVLNPIRAGGG